jgi:hypothetical protein
MGERSLIAVLVGAAALVAGCTYSHERARAVSPDTLSPTLGPMTFMEEGNLVILTVGVNATRFHEDDPFVPIGVALGNRRVKPWLSISRESFYLMDTFGRRYGMAGVDEVRRLQRGISQDRRLTSISFHASKFGGFRLFQTEFFPNLAGAILRDRIDLPTFGYLADVLYFPRPEGDLRGGIFELHLRAKELPQEVFVVFEVPVR